jgi:hypothetical protein
MVVCCDRPFSAHKTREEGIWAVDEDEELVVRVAGASDGLEACRCECADEPCVLLLGLGGVVACELLVAGGGGGSEDDEQVDGGVVHCRRRKRGGRAAEGRHSACLGAGLGRRVGVANVMEDRLSLRRAVRVRAFLISLLFLLFFS